MPLSGDRPSQKEEEEEEKEEGGREGIDERRIRASLAYGGTK